MLQGVCKRNMELDLVPAVTILIRTGGLSERVTKVSIHSVMCTWGSPEALGRQTCRDICC